MSVSEQIATQTVTRLLSKPASVHAVLLYGPEPTNNAIIARTLAQGWLCPNLKDAQPCGKCGVCRGFLADRCVDYVQYDPWGPSNLLKVAAIRRIKAMAKDDEAPGTPMLEFLRTAPLMARTKVVVINQADRFVSQASNALLKTLEEPPPYAKIVLSTAEFSRVAPTIRSRCLCVACGYVADRSGPPFVQTFGKSPQKSEFIRNHEAPYVKLWDILEKSKTAPKGAAIGLSEQTRGLTDEFSKVLKSGARLANTEILSCMASWLLEHRPEEPEVAQSVVWAHRMAVGNVGSSALFDLVWSRILA